MPYPALLKIDGIDTRREHKLTAGTVKNIHPCIFFTCVFAGQTRYWLKPPPSVVEMIRWGFSAAAQDAIVQKCPSVDISKLRIFHKWKIRYCLEPLTSCQRSDISAHLNIAFNCCTRMYNSWRWFKWHGSLNFSAVFIYSPWCVYPSARKNVRNFISLKCNSWTKYAFWKLLHSCAKSAHVNTQVLERKLDG